MKIAIVAAALLLVNCCEYGWASGDEASYNQRAAQTDLSLFRELDRAATGLLAREDAQSDLNLGPRFDDIDTNRDGVVTQRKCGSTSSENTARPAPGWLRASWVVGGGACPPCQSFMS